MTDIDGKTIITSFTPTAPATGEITTSEYVDSKVNPGLRSVDEMITEVEVPIETSPELDAELAEEFPDEVGPDISSDDDDL